MAKATTHKYSKVRQRCSELGARSRERPLATLKKCAGHTYQKDVSHLRRLLSCAGYPVLPHWATVFRASGAPLQIVKQNTHAEFPTAIRVHQEARSHLALFT